MLSPEVIGRLFQEGDVVALKMAENSAGKLYHFLIDTVAGPTDLNDFSLGAAAAQNADGTGWDEVTDAQGRYLLEPEYKATLYQIFFGVTPRMPGYTGATRPTWTGGR